MAGDIKFAGYDHIVIRGKADRPSYLVVDDDRISLHDASSLWGKSAYETEKLLLEELGSDFSVMTIGVGGENRVLYACLNTDYYHQSGRGGNGAVFGSKNLKAIAIRGTKTIPVVDLKGLEAFRKRIESSRNRSPMSAFRERYGTMYTTISSVRAGCLPTKNFQEGTFAGGAEKINAFVFRDTLWRSDHACLGCQSPCGKYVTAREGAVKLVGPEYETIALLGSDVGVDDPEMIAFYNVLCDEYGVDTISTGNSIAFAMECYEKGFITKEDTGGLDLSFGNKEAVAEMIGRIARREKGLGDILADGVKRAAEKIGHGSAHFAMHVKGMELAGYDPRSTFAMGLAYAVNTRGGCHRRAKPIEVNLANYKYDQFGAEGNALIVKNLQDFRESVHCACLCDAELRFSFEATLKEVAEAMNLVTGWDMTADELKLLADRVYTLIRSYNAREGLGRKDDALPGRALLDSLPDGPAKGKVMTQETLDRMLDDYYELRRWDKTTGNPTRETLEWLGLLDIVDPAVLA
jgi:aldehyde:ferredoxin oxidoreductase